MRTYRPTDCVRKFFVALSVCLLTASTLAEPAEKKPKIGDFGLSEQEARKIGIAEADVQWQQGRAVIYVFGRRAGGTVDENTGLPFNSIAGCIVDDGVLAGTKAHNERIQTLISNHGLPSYSRKPWLDHIQKPAEHLPFDELFSFQMSQKVDGENVSICLELRNDGDKARTLNLTIEDTDDDAEPRICTFWIKKPPADAYAAWGPKDSELLYVLLPLLPDSDDVTGDEGKVQIYVVDLRFGRVLHQDTMDKPLPRPI